MAGKIFINYRRSLNLVEAQLLQKVLQRHFGKAGVFLDVSGLEGGEHWLHALEGQVDASVAMVSLIAKGWTAVADERGQRRLDNPDDFVRFEIARAFSRKIPVLPLLLNGAGMPGVADLPLNLVQLAFQQAMHLRNETFDDDADKIAQRLKALIAPPRQRLSYRAAGAIAASALLVGLAGGHSLMTGLGIIQPSTDAGIRAELNAAETKRTVAESNYAVALRERDQARAELKRAREDLAAAEAKAEKLEGQLNNAGEALKEARADTRKAQADAKGAAGRVAHAEEELAAAQAKAGEAETAARLAAEAKQKLKDAQADLKAANERANRAEAELTKGPSQQPREVIASAPAEASKKLAKAPLTLAEETAFARSPGKSFFECTDCPEMVIVPAGSFTMGASDAEIAALAREYGKDKEQYFKWESPQHKVTISKPFAVGKSVVTFDEWEACVSGGGCAGNRSPSDSGWGKGKRPVIHVSWKDAQEYVTWLKRKTGKEYRLLTEEEWEYSARGGKQTRFFWGNDLGKNHANCDGCGSEWDNKETAPVGKFDHNDFGLFDMAGNVLQWTEDCWNESYHNGPSDEKAISTKDCTWRVVRGGSWNYIPRDARAAARYRLITGLQLNFLGFRVARTLD
jgi:formylglycine-generating enzyme required for sulfatase activity